MQIVEFHFSSNHPRKYLLFKNLQFKNQTVKNMHSNNNKRN